MAASILLVYVLSHFMMCWPTEAQEGIGCFSFNFGNTVLSVEAHDKIGSIAACIQLCQTRRDTYAGVRYGKQCYCGDSHDHTVNGEQLSDNDCTTQCNDHRRECGDVNSIVIYSVCKRGRYRDHTSNESNCNASCKCKDNHICIYNTGVCPANCALEWSGPACNVKVVQPKTEAATPMRQTDNRVTALTDEGAKVTVSSGPNESTNNVAGTGPSERLDDDNDGISVTAVAVGVSLAVLVLVVVIISPIVYFRTRRKPYKSGYEIDEGTTTPEVKTDYSKAKQTENEPTIYTATESPEPCYSSVDYLSNGPANNNGEDIPKSDDDVAINGELEMVEYAVVKKPGDARHVNLKENSLYGTNDGVSDEEGQE